MHVCISGWYFHRPLLRAIADSGYPALIVGHREKAAEGIPIVRTPEGRGLDFGCYHQYLMDCWDGHSDVLFMQDDGEAAPSAFDDIAAIAKKTEIDHAYIFRDEYDEFANGGMSSRAMWCRASFLTTARIAGGFEVDWANIGNTEGKQANWALWMFDQRHRPNPRCGWIAIVPGLQMGRRGWISNTSYCYKRTGGQEGVVTPEPNTGVSLCP